MSQTSRLAAFLLIAAFVMSSAAVRFAGADDTNLASPGVVLLDFETDAELRLWHDERQPTLGGGKTLARVPHFATRGSSALEFRTPAWKPGMAEWPAFECQPPIADWSRFDRLMFDVTNASASSQHLGLFLSDSQQPTRQGLGWSQRLPPRSYTRVVLDLPPGLRDRQVNPADIRVMHFYTERPATELAIYIDGLMLLERGQSLSPLPEGYLADLAALQSAAVAELRAALAQRSEHLVSAATAIPSVADWVAESLRGFQSQLAALDARTRQSGDQALALPGDLAGLEADLARLEGQAALRIGFEPIRAVVQAAGATRDDVIVGFATSMEKVLPRADLPPLQTKPQIELALARGEREALQVVVIPCRADLQQAEVRVSDLTGPEGCVLSAAQVKISPVGYVETRGVPPYGTSHVGWWPDPILEFMTAVDVAQGDAQAFWVRVHAPRDQAAGQYQGQLQIRHADGPLFAWTLTVRIYGFAVPAASPLPLAVTFAPHDHPTAASREAQAAWRNEADYPIQAWQKHKLRWVDFLADYYLTYDSLYTREGPDFEALERLRQQGRLGCFNLGYFDPCGASPVELERWKQRNLDRLRRQYEQAKSRGLLEHAYIYGCDENPRETFPDVQRAAALLKAEFPDVVVMTTTYDHSYGRDTEIQAVDAWCPLTPRFDAELADQARAAGRYVWWYICCGPHHPPANMFIEYPAIEGRLLMGPMTAKYRPDGFLYYQISIWNARRPIAGGPLTDWDPRSWTSYHGDGSWTCVGPDGTPLPTIRLENFRDGLDDYAYFCILEQLVQQLESRAVERTAAQRAWLTEARAALQVPEALVRSMGEYSRDPATLYAWRNRLGELIDQAGAPHADPWGARFGARGFRSAAAP